ncbi:MAG TPA: efflux RND transporter periplasmic adaptor subunit [Phycisphaerae bacterium]|mgnify:CR=1 FL=1|nr:efflux RND transporter periplasmic adaptor subunit [Phycisphaerae bacterium]HRW52576.1 efflux RND transporter periplasmic adaptor subunit [Phycisphaerae bacterium]
MTKPTLLILCLPLALSTMGCRRSTTGADAGTKLAPAVHVDNPTTESSLTTVRLSPSARSHLDIGTSPVEMRNLANRRTYGGEAVIPEGRAIVISAPLAGTVVDSGVGDFATPGSRVQAGDALFGFLPSIRGAAEVLNPSDRIALARARADLESTRAQAAGDVEAATVRLDGARIALERAEALVRQNAGSQRALDEARGAHQLAQASLDAATARKRVLDDTMSLLAGASEAAHLVVRAPFTGFVRRLPVTTGMIVAAGTPLCEIAATNPLWIRVTVYAGDVGGLKTDAPAMLRLLGASPAPGAPIAPIIAPPTANANTSSVDLYYAMTDATIGLQPGQRCVVDIPVAGESESRVIPQSAIVYDIHGDAWVYVETGADSYARRRVSIRRIEGGLAEVASGVEVGDSIVHRGAAELFGVEFGSAGH